MRYLPILVRIASLTLYQSYYCPATIKRSLMDMKKNNKYHN